MWFYARTNHVLACGSKMRLENSSSQSNCTCLILLIGDWEYSHFLGAMNRMCIMVLYRIDFHCIVAPHLLINNQVLLKQYKIRLRKKISSFRTKQPRDILHQNNVQTPTNIISIQQFTKETILFTSPNIWRQGIGIWP